eukprot:3227624-Pleurochrysis_carterae.AAC.1
MNDPKLSRARARRPANDESMRSKLERESIRSKLKRLADRARHDGFMRYRADTLPPGVKLCDHAKEDACSRYDTGEPHPLDGDGAIL